VARTHCGGQKRVTPQDYRARAPLATNVRGEFFSSDTSASKQPEHKFLFRGKRTEKTPAREYSEVLAQTRVSKTPSSRGGRCLLSKAWFGARPSPHPSHPPPLSSRPPIQHTPSAAPLRGNITRVTRRGVLTGC